MMLSMDVKAVLWNSPRPPAHEDESIGLLKT
jgi:hypothetical protein